MQIGKSVGELLATLRDETAIIVAFFLDSTSDGEFLIVFRKPESLEISRRAVEASAHDIDRYHNRQKRMWESGTPLEALVDLDRISEAGNQWPMDSLFC